MKIFRITLMVFILLFAAQGISPQEEGGPAVLVKTSPENPAALSSWALTLVIDHPIPEEVTVMAPPFTDAFVLDRYIKIPYTADQIPKTQAEYRFTLHNSGTFTLEPFTVITPAGQSVTPPVTVNVRRARTAQEIPRLRLVWEGIPSTLKAGETAEIGLRLQGSGSPPPLPEAKLFVPQPPRGLILEGREPNPGEKNAGIMVLLRIIPLEALDVLVPGRTVTTANALFEVPPLRIQAGAAVAHNAMALPDAPSAGEKTSAGADAGKTAPSFPSLEDRRNSRLFAKYRQDCERIYQTAKNLWERGYRAESLAELRRNERDHPAGRFFRELRREAERGLGLSETGDEKRGARLPFMITAAVFFILAVAAICLRGKRRRFYGGIFAAASVLLTAAGLVCLYPLVKPLLTRESAGTSAPYPRSGVAKETEVRRIPDFAGTVILNFSEGQPVRIIERSEKNASQGIWHRVIAHNDTGESGWVREERIVFY